MKLVHKYLEGALNQAIQDRKKLQDELNFFLTPIKADNIGIISKQLDMHNAGFSTSEQIGKIVKIESAIADLKKIIFYEKN